MLKNVSELLSTLSSAKAPRHESALSKGKCISGTAAPLTLAATSPSGWFPITDQPTHEALPRGLTPLLSDFKLFLLAKGQAFSTH